MNLGLQRTHQRHAVFQQFCLEDIIETCVYEENFKQVVTDIYNHVDEPKQQNFVQFVLNTNTNMTERFWNILEDTGKQAIYQNLNILLNNGKANVANVTTVTHSVESITSIHSSTNSLHWQFSSQDLLQTIHNPFDYDSDFEWELEDIPRLPIYNDTSRTKQENNGQPCPTQTNEPSIQESVQKRH